MRDCERGNVNASLRRRQLPAATPTATAAVAARFEAIARGGTPLSFPVFPLHFVFHLLTFLQVRSTVFSSTFPVNENVLAPIVRTNESPTFVLEELFDGTRRHGLDSSEVEAQVK